eukprot:300099-Pyramimonas_sp.AAC.1
MPFERDGLKPPVRPHVARAGASAFAPLAVSVMIARWNPAAAARTGIPVDAMVGEPIGKMFVVADVAK